MFLQKLFSGYFALFNKTCCYTRTFFLLYGLVFLLFFFFHLPRCGEVSKFHGCGAVVNDAKEKSEKTVGGTPILEQV